jgi:predicted ATPase
MGIKGFNPEALNEVISLNMKASLFNDTKVSIADVGFGISQIFPIILEGLRIPKGSTLLLEQPEIHLHPNLQMQMADYFIGLALSGKNIIAETHSDHVINRLVRRIIQDKEYNLVDKIGIYFISQTENGSEIQEIKIDDKRGIVNWPKDFFDQTATEQELIIRAGIEKRKAGIMKEAMDK